RSALKEAVPEYMVPSAFVVLPAMPLTANGKVDRKALPEPRDTGVEVSGAYVAPRTPTEEVLAGVWAQVLGVGRVGAQDNFFELGGHSLLATQAISRIRTAFGVELPLRALFEEPTVARMATRIDDALRGSTSEGRPPLVAGHWEGAAPLSFAQQRLWFIDQFEPESASYNIPAAVRLEGTLDVSALERSLHALTRRHETLRTRIRAEEGHPAQLVSPDVELPLTHVDLSALPEAAREEEARRIAGEEARRPFDLARGPLLRTTLVRLSEQQHELLLTMHHIVSDGGSMGVLVRELSALYTAFRAGQTPTLPALPVQYADYAAWQRNWLRGEVLETQLRWWTRQLEGAPPALELMTDRLRPAVQSFRGARLPVALPSALSESLKRLGRSEGVTSFMLLLAAWQVLLSRYSGQDDISVGTPVAGRDRTELEGLIGFFVNTLVLRTRFEGEPTFRDVLTQVRETTLGAFAHQEVPFEKLVDALAPERDLRRSPLFQVMFALNQDVLSEQRLPGLSLRPIPPDDRTAKYELTLTLSDTPAGFSGSIEYNTDLFDAGTVERMAGHLEVLLTAIAANPDAKVGRLELLTARERQRQVVAWNATRTAYPREKCVHTLVTEQVERTPDAVALDFAGEQRTYRQVETRANQLAHRLMKLGVGRGSRVGLCVERGVGMVEGMLGILKAGGAYVPLDASYPLERLAFMVQDAGVDVLVTQGALMAVLPSGAARVVRLDDGSLDAEPTHAPQSGVEAEDPAYVIYTSGSTGTPKGVWVPHRAVVRLVVETNFIQLTAEDRIAQVSNASFDAATFEVWGVLLHGGRLVGVTRDVALSPPAFAAFLRDERISVLFVTTALFNQLVAHSADTFQTLRQLHVGGEAVDPGAMRTALTRGPPRKLMHVYGPTESTTFATWHEVAEVASDAVTVPIGKALSNTELYVLDSRWQPVPVGVPGELYIGGDGLALGYLGRPALTAEKFVPHPFSPKPGARLYRTGDQVKQSPDGAVVFLSRLDSQVKVRGFRIELGEVESALIQREDVRESVVVVREDTLGHRRLVAYVVGQPGAGVTAEGLRAELKARLPEYMVPAAFVVMDALPLTPNGKVNRRALPAPEQAGPANAAYDAPSTATEETLAGVWARVLGVERVGVRENFFALGGDSILSIQVVAKAGQAGLKVTPKQLFQNPTVEQ
ncbi:MAG: amino acid adenylation domain-containing protein, partial [Myxococcaceae bacterium]